MPDFPVAVVCNGVTVTGTARTPGPVAVASNPTRLIDVGPPTIVTSTLPAATLDAAFTVTLNATGGFGGHTWAVLSGSLPSGLTLSSAGVLSGTPTSLAAIFTFTVSVTDTVEQSDTQQLTLTVVADDPAPPTDHGSHIGDWMIQTGDQVLTAPDRTYDAENINLASSVHAATAGTYGGWLIIEAENLHGAVLDLSDLALHLESTSQGGATPRRMLRILFVGFKVINGQIPCEWLKWVRFWYCDFTFPPSEWNSQYTAAYQPLHGGSSPVNLSTIDDNAIADMANPYGTTLSGNFCDFFELFFCDFYAIYDDGVYLTACDSWFLRGCRWWDVYNHNIQYKLASGATRAHSDAIQAEGGVTNLVTNNCFFNHLQVAAAGAGSSSIYFNNFWLMAGDNVGITGGNDSPRTLSGTIKGGKWCGLAQYQPSDKTNPTYSVSQFGTYTVGGVTLAWNDRLAYGEGANQLGNVVWKRPNGTTMDLLTATSEWFGYPSGVTQPGSATASPGIISPDLTDSPIRTIVTSVIANHATNPAVVDRAVSGNAFGDWAAFFAASRTDGSCGTTSGSATVTDASCVANDVGKLVSGTGIPAESRIVEVNAGVSFVISKTATATGTASLTLKYGWP